MAIFLVPHSLCPITYIKYSQSTIFFLQVVKTWSREPVSNERLLGDAAEADRSKELGFCCKSGTHRCVATARFIREMLEMDGFKTVQPKHLSFGTWKSRNRCHTCHECCLDNSDKQAVFAIAYAKWCALP